MDGILVIDKPKGITSRDVVNEVIKKLGIKKVGHTGTLDPIATGLLVVCVGRATKLVEELTSNDKEYIASVCLGISTDTLDSDGKVLSDDNCSATKDQIIDVLNSFKGAYFQEVPKYSAIKVNGKKLYEYARNNEDVILPKRKVNINSIEIIGDIKSSDGKVYFSFKCSVSKGTYIRSLIRDIAVKLNTVGIMTDLRRIRQGNFNIEDSISLDEISKLKLKKISDVLDIKKIELTSDIEKKVINGTPINNIYNSNEVMFMKNNDVIAIYKGNDILKPYKMLKGGIL